MLSEAKHLYARRRDPSGRKEHFLKVTQQWFYWELFAL
jgi:hypothetical protein